MLYKRIAYQIRFCDKEPALRRSVRYINQFPDAVAVEAVYFGDTEGAYEELRDRTSVSVLYQPGVNEYNGRRSIQLVIKDYI